LADGGKVTGWMAAADSAGTPLFLSSGTTPQAGVSTPTTTPPRPAPIPTPPPAQPAIQGKFNKGQQITVSNFANMRKSAGYVNKNPDDVVIDILINTAATVLGGPALADNLTWWQIRSTGSNRATVEGWVAEADPNGVTILSAGAPTAAAPVATSVPSTAQIRTYSVGDMVVNISGDIVNLRNSPGYVGKPASDVVSQLPDQAALVVKEGPRDADGLVWWKVSGSVPGASRVEGWLAEAAPNGVRLMAPSQFSRILKVGTPFVGSFAMSQGWGSNPQFYAQFLYDGVALKGHNGLDFGTPTGTRLVSPDSGEVIRVDFEAGGFGNFVLIRHRWGESLCAHMNRVTVSVGQTVERGTPIGESGNTGAGTGPHLHFGIRITPYRRTDGWGGFTDPRPFMNPNDIVGTRGGVETPEPMAPEVPGRSRP
jgi:murein DD-endopeptidase MepM/ murein hydrolase activator NlpD